MRRCAAIVAAWVAIGWSTGVLAGPVDFAQIDAEAGWLAHLDVDALRNASLFDRAFRRLSAEHPQLEKQLEALSTLFDLDLRRDLYAITAYGKRFAEHEGVLLVHARFKVEALRAKANWLPEHQIIRHGRFDLHTWVDAKGKPDERRVAAAFFTDQCVAFSPRMDELKAALDVLAGTAPGLPKDSPLAAPVPEGTVLVARAIRLSSAPVPFKSPLVTQSEAFSLVLGESGGQVFAEARLRMKSPESARLVKEILEGIGAMAVLQGSDDSSLAALLRRFEVGHHQTEATVAFRAPADEVWREMDRQWSRLAQTRGRKPLTGAKP